MAIYKRRGGWESPCLRRRRPDHRQWHRISRQVQGSRKKTEGSDQTQGSGDGGSPPRGCEPRHPPTWSGASGLARGQRQASDSHLKATRDPSDFLRVSKDRPTAVPTGVPAGRSRPSRARLGVLAKVLDMARSHARLDSGDRSLTAASRTRAASSIGSTSRRRSWRRGTAGRGSSPRACGAAASGRPGSPPRCCRRP